MSAVRFLLFLCFFPVLLVFLIGGKIYGKLYGKKQHQQAKKRQEFKKKLLVHIKNFSPVRLKNRRWRNISNQAKKKRKKHKNKKNLSSI